MTKFARRWKRFICTEACAQELVCLTSFILCMVYYGKWRMINKLILKGGLVGLVGYSAFLFHQSYVNLSIEWACNHGILQESWVC